MKSYNTIEEIFRYYQKANKVVTLPDTVEPGDLFIAYQNNRPLNRAARVIWDFIESYAPGLLNVIILAVVRFRISIKVRENRVEGNRFAALALSRGAQIAIVDNPSYCKDPRTRLVRNTRETLSELAKLHRQTLLIPFLAVTGSNGKTTTKELIKTVLSTHLETIATSGSGNSVPAISRTILSIKKNIDVAVFEMGIMAKGELSELCHVAQPTYGLITSIGLTHLEHLIDIDGVAEAKGELFKYLRAYNGHIFVNLNDERVVALARNNENVTTYGDRETASVRGEVISSDPFLKIRLYLPKSEDQQSLDRFEFQTKLAGEHNLNNVLASIAVGLHFKVPLKKILSAIEGFKPMENRFQIIESGSNKIILDAYNANPSSVIAALRSLQRMNARRKVTIIGDMLDLGRQSKNAHKAVLHEIKSYKDVYPIFVGKEFLRVRESNVGMYLSTTDEAKKWYQSQNFEDTYILLKGSRWMKMEKIIEA